jgi:GTP-binding protein HflX
VTRGRRNRSGIPVVSIVGYTNAGKSTILNKMTRSGVTAEDKLFATLDPTSRRMRFPEQREVLLTDTVGFIRNLPKELLEAFRSTLEEVLEGDLVLHVVDAASPEIDTHMETVNSLLDELGAQDTPRLVVLNQIDRVPPERWQELKERYGAVLTSAVTGEGMDALLLEIERRLFRARAKEGQEAGL